MNENGSPNDQIQLVPHAEIQMLGVPLGTGAFVSSFVEKKSMGRLQKTVDRLVEFEDTQEASYLLRMSFGIVRAVHFMRTTPLAFCKDQSLRFDGSACERENFGLPYGQYDLRSGDEAWGVRLAPFSRAR